MTPDEFEETLANLAAGFYVNAEILRRFVAEAVRLREENTRLQARLDEIETDRLPDGFIATARSVWPGE